MKQWNREWNKENKRRKTYDDAKKKRRAILISVILGILIIIATVCGILYATTDMFKSNSVLFEKYARQLLENLDDVMNEEYMNEIEEILNNNKLTSNTTVTMNYNENGDTSNPINNIQMNISGKEEKVAGYHYKDITLKQNDETLAGIEYLEDGNIAGVRLNGIRQYLSTNTENKDENEIYNLYELIHTDIPEVLGLNSEECNSLKEKYIGIIWKNIANATFSKQSGMLIEINGAQYNTNVYSITITKEQFNNIYLQILEELGKDEIILSKIEAIDSKLNEYHNFLQDGEISNLKQEFIDEINNTIQNIQNFNIGNDERTISVFESNGIAISLSIDTEKDFTGLDVVNGESTNFINILGNEKIEDGEKENSFDFKIEKTAAINDETIAIQYNIVEEGEKITNECHISRKMENSNVHSNIEFVRNVGQNALKITAETSTDIVNDFEEKEELVENENNIIMEKLNDEQKENVRNNVKENITNQINTFLQVLPMEKINQMLVNLNLMEEELDDLSGEGTVTEVEKNRFNSKFELYEGEHITKERIEELIDVVKDDLQDVRITNYREEGLEQEKFPLEYRLIIEKGTNNTELAESVINYIEEKYTQEFSVRLEYDEATGLINNIYITVMEN